MTIAPRCSERARIRAVYAELAGCCDGCVTPVRAGGRRRSACIDRQSAFRGAELAARRAGAVAAAVRESTAAARPAGDRLRQRGCGRFAIAAWLRGSCRRVEGRPMDDAPVRCAPALERYRDGPPRQSARLSGSARARAGAGARRPAGRRRRADQQRHRDASAGALAVSRRHSGAGAQGVPVHAADRLQGPALRHAPCWSPASPPTAMSIASASASRSKRSARHLGEARSPIPIAPRDRRRMRRATTS